MADMSTEEVLRLAAGMAETAKRLAEEAEDRQDWRQASEYWQAATFCDSLAGKLQRAIAADAKRVSDRNVR